MAGTGCGSHRLVDFWRERFDWIKRQTPLPFVTVPAIGDDQKRVYLFLEQAFSFVFV